MSTDFVWNYELYCYICVNAHQDTQAMKNKMTLVELLQGMRDTHENLKSDNFPFNDRELAKAELVRGLLNKVESGRVTT